VPLIIGENDQAFSAAAYLQTQGLAVRAVRPPTVMHGSERPRFSLTSGTSDDELVRLESSLNSWREQESWYAAVARA
jgi:8-amino-7-oxononanoate synthase